MKEQPAPEDDVEKRELGRTLPIVALSLRLSWLSRPILFISCPWPPYTEFAHLWTTHCCPEVRTKSASWILKRNSGRVYKLEKSGRTLQEALRWYQKLEKQYAGLPQAGKLATLQIRKLSKVKGKKAPTPQKGSFPMNPEKGLGHGALYPP